MALNTVHADSFEPRNEWWLFPQHPCRIQMSAPSGGGKTNLALNLLMHKKSPWNVVYLLYKADQAKYDKLREFVQEEDQIDAMFESEGIPEEEELEKMQDMLQTHAEEGHQQIIVLDDLMAEASKHPFITSLAVAGVHHLNLSTLYLTQEIFLKGQGRTQRLQLDYLFLWAFPADMSTVSRILAQMAPGKGKEVFETYRDIVKKPYAWMLIDLVCQKYGWPQLRVRNNALDKIVLDEHDRPPF